MKIADNIDEILYLIEQQYHQCITSKDNAKDHHNFGRLVLPGVQRKDIIGRAQLASHCNTKGLSVVFIVKKKAIGGEKEFC